MKVGILACALLATLPSLAPAATITVNGGSLTTIANTNSQVASTITPLLTLNTSKTAISGGDSATSNYTFSTAGFFVTTTQSRTGASGSYVQSTGSVNFTIDSLTTNLRYTLSGLYQVNDLNNLTPGFTIFRAALRDNTTAAFRFNNDQESVVTADSSFAIGGPPGDFGSPATGNLTDLLAAGHSYTWSYSMLTMADDADGGATATGNVGLQFSINTAPDVATATPLPAASWLGLGLLGTLASAAGVRRGVRRLV